MLRSRRMSRVALGLGLVLALALTACSGQRSGGTESPFEDETLTVILGSTPGGGFDTYMRLVQPFLEQELGTTIEIQYEPGAGGLLAWNRVASARPDRATIGFVQVGPLVFNLIAGIDEGVEFDVTKLTYFGNLVGPGWVFAVGAGSHFTTLEDILRNDQQFVMGSAGASTSYVFWAIMMDAFGLQGSVDQIVTGYDGTDELLLAITRGDVDGALSPATTAASHFTSGDMVPLVMVDTKRSELLPDTPTIFEQQLQPQQEEAMRAFVDATTLTRLFVGPPDMPQDQVEALRSALRRAVDNEEFRREAAEHKLPIDFLDGPTAQQLVTSTLDAPPESLRKILPVVLAPR